MDLTKIIRCFYLFTHVSVYCGAVMFLKKDFSPQVEFYKIQLNAKLHQNKLNMRLIFDEV